MKKYLLLALLFIGPVSYGQVVIDDTNYTTYVSDTMTNVLPVPPRGYYGVFCYVVNRGTNNIIIGGPNGFPSTVINANGGSYSQGNYLYNKTRYVIGTTPVSNFVSVWYGWGK